MVFCYNGYDYEVEVIRKNNKNTYIRVKNDKIVVTTHYFVSNGSISKMLNDSRISIEKMLNRSCKKCKKNDIFYLFGLDYQIIFDDVKNVLIDKEHRSITVSSESQLDKYLRKEAENLYYQRLIYYYKLFEERIPVPSLKIRKMTSRWGVCNTKTYCITLNLELIHYSLDCLDYVVVHELSHLVVPNHSKDFWNVVSKYCSNYKLIRKKLRDLC